MSRSPAGTAVVGSPETVLNALGPQLAETGCKLSGVPASRSATSRCRSSLRSLDLFSKHVMPALRQGHRVSAE